MSETAGPSGEPDQLRDLLRRFGKPLARPPMKQEYIAKPTPTTLHIDPKRRGENSWFTQARSAGGNYVRAAIN